MTSVVRAVAALALVAAPLAAQAPGLPVHGGGFRNGFELAATVGWAGSSSQTGKATTVGATAGYGWARVGLAGTVAAADLAGEDWNPSLGLLASVLAFGNGVDTPFELSFFGGYGGFTEAGYDVADETGVSTGPGRYGNWRAPLGAALVAAITTPIASLRPWIAPRAEFLSENGSTTAKFAGSVGLDLRFAGGLGLRALWEKVPDQDQTLGVGLSYRF